METRPSIFITTAVTPANGNKNITKVPAAKQQPRQDIIGMFDVFKLKVSKWLICYR